MEVLTRVLHNIHTRRKYPRLTFLTLTERKNRRSSYLREDKAKIVISLQISDISQLEFQSSRTSFTEATDVLAVMCVHKPYLVEELFHVI